MSLLGSAEPAEPLLPTLTVRALISTWSALVELEPGARAEGLAAIVNQRCPRVIPMGGAVAAAFVLLQLEGRPFFEERRTQVVIGEAEARDRCCTVASGRSSKSRRAIGTLCGVARPSQTPCSRVSSAPKRGNGVHGSGGDLISTNAVVLTVKKYGRQRQLANGGGGHIYGGSIPVIP